ncbi:MAG TPA: cupredoxin domain-containing protein [Acidimicrobiales bacterium]|jgi:plastocyanin|nr:cupredoxin domain-containing protein [Acidimicrobiales bacterium]
MRLAVGAVWARGIMAGAACLLAVGGLAGCSSGSSNPVLTIHNFKFSPQPLTIKVGQQLTIRNLDSSLHGFATDDGTDFVGAVNPGGIRQTSFAKPGRYTYHCTLHAAMKGVLIVR